MQAARIKSQEKKLITKVYSHMEIDQLKEENDKRLFFKLFKNSICEYYKISNDGGIYCLKKSEG